MNVKLAIENFTITTLNFKQKERKMRYSIVLVLLATTASLSACGGDETPVGSISQAVVGEGHLWTHSDWSSRVAYEARYALSQSANGVSSRPIPGVGYYGDWNYVANDSFAHSRASAEAGGGDWVGPVGESGGYYLGGQCTYFVRLVLYRATYWAFSDHYTTPNYGMNPWHGMYEIGYIENKNAYPSQWQPGWVLLSATCGHYAIAEQRAYNGGWGWWVIDSNYVGGGGNFRIGKHFFTDSQLVNCNYFGSQPYRASYNW